MSSARVSSSYPTSDASWKSCWKVVNKNNIYKDMNCRKKKKKSKPIRWREEPKIVLTRKQSVHLKRENSRVPGENSCSCSATKHKPLPINHSRRLTLATNAMISDTTPFLYCRLQYGFNWYHNSDVCCCCLRP